MTILRVRCIGILQWQHPWPIDHNAIAPGFACVASTLDVAITRSNSTDAGVRPFRFLPKSIHAYLIDDPIALWLSVATGVAALLLAALTYHPTGLIRVIPYWLHL